MAHGKIIRSAGVVGGFTLLSRGLGMVRDSVFAYFFGTSLIASTFWVAFMIPNLFRRLFGEGALTAALIPVLIETRTKEGDRSAWELTAKVISLLLLILTSISLVGVLIYSICAKIPGLSEKWLINFELSRVMFPYVMFICFAAVAMAVLNSYKHFSTSAFAPCLLNFLLIVVMLAVFPLVKSGDMGRAYVLAWTVIVAGIAQVAIQIPPLRRLGFKFYFTAHWKDPRVNRILLLMGPAALGAGITQLNVLIDKYLAIWIGEWAPSALFYSERMIYFPLGIIATALGTVLLPTFSDHAASKDMLSMRKTINRSLRQLLFIMTPAALGLLVLAPNIMQLLFDWGGQFDAHSTDLCSIALRCYAPGLIVFSLAKIFIPAFYSMQDTRTPIKIGMGTVVLNLTLNITFIITFPTEIKHAGMALATVIAEAAGMITLGIVLSRRVGSIGWAPVFSSFFRCLLAALLMGITVWFAAQYLMPYTTSLCIPKVAQLLSTSIAMLAGMLVYFLCTLLLRVPELRELIQGIKQK